jgi:superfamily II DNA or RNA helicase
MITIQVANVISKIIGLNDKYHIDALDKILSYFVQGYFHTAAFKKGFYDPKTKEWTRWDGKKHLLSKKLTFPSGTIHYVTKYFSDLNLPYQIEDFRKDPTPRSPIPIINASMEYREYQQRCIDAALRDKNCIIQAATGSGKSYIATSIIAKLNLKSVIYVHTKDLLRQMIDDIKSYTGVEAGQIGDGKVDIKYITVAMVQTVSQAFDQKYIKYDDEELSVKDKLRLADKENIRQFVKEVELFIFDEAHHVSSESCQIIATKSINARYRIGMSGTAWRDDGADLLIEAATGKKTCIVSATELIRLGILTKPIIYLYKNATYIGKESNYAGVYREYITENKDRNLLISKIAYQLVQKKKKVLISVKYINHGNILYDMLKDYVPTEFVRGELKSEDREYIKSSFENGDLKVLIATSLYDEGINIPALDAIVLAGGGKSSTRAIQRIGRTLRRYENKDRAIAIDFIDDAKFLLKHSKKRIKMYETEPGLEIKYL